MITTERPCCDTPFVVDYPLPETLHCDDCAVSWTVTDPDSQPAAALAA